MTRIITEPEFVDAVRNVLNKRGPNFKYEAIEVEGGTTCVYSTDGESGSCLFGAAFLDELNLPYDPAWEGATVAQIIRREYVYDDTIDEITYNFDVPSHVTVAAHEAQRLQDSGHAYYSVSREFEWLLANPND